MMKMRKISHKKSTLCKTPQTRLKRLIWRIKHKFKTWRSLLDVVLQNYPSKMEGYNNWKSFWRGH